VVNGSLPPPNEISTGAPDIGHRLRMLRPARRLKAHEVAAAAGLSAPQLSRSESGKHEPLWTTVMRVYCALGIALREEVIDSGTDRNRAA
jgi:transcriptional regulator with XRE-family HTH domain